MTSISSVQSLNNRFFSFDEFPRFIVKWAPRAIVAGLAGYYSLGFAYEIGLMARIDRIAINILRHYVGYMGIGAIMPTFQWYAAWSVRISTALLAGLVYDLAERVVIFSINYCFPSR